MYRYVKDSTVYAIVISYYECDIIVITQVGGAAEDEC